MPSTKYVTQKVKKRILIVDCFFDDSRQSVRRTTKMPQVLGLVFLAGAFKPETCEVRLYNEVDSGPLLDENLLGWPDMLVLTGLTNTFDRLLHLTAYARTKNPKVIVVAGGPPIRALPFLARRYFDYCCLGDVEQMRDVINDAFGPAWVAEEILPRFDLAYWFRHFNYVETTRNCNFRCSFCALTGEGHEYQKYDLDYVRKQIVSLKKRRYVVFADNNFYGNDRNYFLARLELIKEMMRAGHMKEWAALVTGDFFLKDENLKIIREAGCGLLFSGVESFDTEWLLSANKPQNTRAPQVEMIRKCLESGIVFCYGMILDVTTRHIADLRREIEFVLDTPVITLPSFLTLPIPLLGTPFFYECLNKGIILPNTRLRDMDGSTVVLRPLDPVDDVLNFLQEILTMRGYKLRVINHSLRFIKRYHSTLLNLQLATCMMNAALLAAYGLATSPTSLRSPSAMGRNRTFLSTTEVLDVVYQPAFHVEARYESYFKPTMITDKHGKLAEEVAESVLQKKQILLAQRKHA